MKTLTVYINNESVYEYDRNVDYEAEQLAFFDKMDKDMGNGIKIRGELITQPDSEERRIFVAMNLIRALQQDNDAIISATCAYLTNSNPNLFEVHANDSDNGVLIEFIS